MSDREQVDLNDGTELMPPDDAPAADLLADDLIADDLLSADAMVDEPASDDWVDPLEEPYDHTAEQSTPAHRSGVPAKQPLPPPEPKRKASPIALGLLLFAATLVAGLGLGYGALTVVGGRPQQLLNFDGLMQIDRILAFDQYPTNLFWMMAVGAGLIAFLVGAAVARAIRGANARVEQAEQMVDRITALDIEDEQGWQNEELCADPRASAFAANTLGAYRLLQAKTARYIGQEGELHRLEKALVEGTRVDLADGYENPAVGSLADEILRVFDDWVAAAQESKQCGQKLSASGGELVGIVSDACAWNSATLERINAQGASLERLGVKIGNLAELDQDSGNEPADDVHTELVAGLEEDIEALAEAFESLPDAEAASEIVEIVHQASKLTFQVAMETARLGDHGEKLLPMTQDLEELITAARDLAGRRSRKSGAGSKFGRLFKRMRKRAAALGASVSSGSDTSEITDVLGGEIGPLTKQISEGVRSIAHKFPLQTDRLNQLGISCSELTGAEFDPSQIDAGNPNAAASGALSVDAFDPFADRAAPADPEQAGLVSDPFAAAPSSPLGDAPPREDADSESASGSSTGMSPALEGFSLDTAPEDPQDSAADLAESAESTSDPAPTAEPSAAEFVIETAAAEPPAAAVEPTPDEIALPEDPIQPVDDSSPVEPATEPATEPAIELVAEPAEPAAKPVTEPAIELVAEPAEPAAEPLMSETATPADEADRVYDLAELGAVALDEGADPAPEQEDRIYELSELGAVAVE